MKWPCGWWWRWCCVVGWAAGAGTAMWCWDIPSCGCSSGTVGCLRRMPRRCNVGNWGCDWRWRWRCVGGWAAGAGTAAWCWDIPSCCCSSGTDGCLRSMLRSCTMGNWGINWWWMWRCVVSWPAEAGAAAGIAARCWDIHSWPRCLVFGLLVLTFCWNAELRSIDGCGSGRFCACRCTAQAVPPSRGCKARCWRLCRAWVIVPSACSRCVSGSVARNPARCARHWHSTALVLLATGCPESVPCCSYGPVCAACGIRDS